MQLLQNLVKNPDSDDKLKNVNRKATSNETKQGLFENELKVLQTFDSSLLWFKPTLTMGEHSLIQYLNHSITF